MVEKIIEWSTKQKRAYHRVKSGVRLASLTNTPIQHIVLTTSEIAKNRNICNDFQVLRKRVKRRWNIDLSYFCVKTYEGYGVLHLVVKDKGFIPQRWLSKNWNEIHKSSYVYIKRPPKHIANYVVSQYVSNQKSSYQRCSWSQTWVCQGFVKIWKYCKHLSKRESDWKINLFNGDWYKPVNILLALRIWEKFIEGLSKKFNEYSVDWLLLLDKVYWNLDKYNEVVSKICDKIYSEVVVYLCESQKTLDEFK